MATECRQELTGAARPHLDKVVIGSLEPTGRNTTVLFGPDISSALLFLSPFQHYRDDTLARMIKQHTEDCSQMS